MEVRLRNFPQTLVEQLVVGVLLLNYDGID